MNARRYQSVRENRLGRSAARPASEQSFELQSWRYRIVIFTLAACFIVLLWRVVSLHVIDHEFLNSQGDLRTIRHEAISATRGKILDRNGEPLAVSAPVITLWANPSEVNVRDDKWQDLTSIAGLNYGVVIERIKASAEAGKAFAYIARQIAPEIGQQAMQLKLRGLYSARSHKRYYPAGEVAAHVVGMTNIDERGQEGLELAFDQYLLGVSGEKKVLKDRRGYVVADLSLIRDAQPGQDVQLSIDLRLQTLAYRELKAAVASHRAKAASLIMLDVNSGEVLAMVNQPSYNPNNRSTIEARRLRNRAVTDVFEPGSPIKALSIAAALQSGKFAIETKVKTSPGFIRLNGRTIRDLRDYGELSLEKVVVKSSNVGTSRIALKLGGNPIWEMLYNAGFGQATGIEYPGEALGDLPNYSRWQPVRLATLSYGYGLSATPLQLAKAYMAIAADGQRRPLTLLKGGQHSAGLQQVMEPWVAQKVKSILAKVVLKGGTGTRAQVSEYRVAGKTGTVHGVDEGGYVKDEYSAIFAGFAPVKEPKLAVVVVVHSPQAGEYYGGEVAAPVFSRVMANSLRLLNVPPDTNNALLARNNELAGQGG